MERHRRHLERKPHGQQAHRGERQRQRADVSLGAPGDGAEVRRVGLPVRERDAVQEERTGERAEQEVLHGALARGEPVREAGQDVQRERQDLERQEHHDEVGRGGDERHARQRE